MVVIAHYFIITIFIHLLPFHDRQDTHPDYCKQLYVLW